MNIIMALGVFQNTALGLAMIALITALIVIAIAMMSTSKSPYPPMVDSCPDYWTTSNYLNPDASKCNKTDFGCCSDLATPKSDADGSNCPIKCYNSHQLGTVSSTCSSLPTEMDFSTDVYTGSSGLCNKQKWAAQCGITWDGVTNVSSGC
jgi:hypothetical protein